MAGARKKTKAKRLSRKPQATPVGRTPGLALTRRLALGTEAIGGFTSSFQNKLDSVHDLELALRAKRTMTASDDTVINPTLNALAAEAHRLEAAIAADDTPVLDGPSPEDAAALQSAIAAAENVIAQNGAVNDLVNAAAALIDTLKSA